MSEVRDVVRHERLGGSALDDLLGKAFVTTEHPRRVYRRINPTPRTVNGGMGLFNLGLAAAIWGAAAFFVPLPLFVIFACMAVCGLLAQAILLIAGPRAFGPIGQGIAIVAAWIGFASLACAVIGAILGMVVALLMFLWMYLIAPVLAVIWFVFEMIVFVLTLALYAVAFLPLWGPLYVLMRMNRQA